MPTALIESVIVTVARLLSYHSAPDTINNYTADHEMNLI